MNTFFKYVQPTIVKTSDNEELKEDLRNLYMVNFNVFGLDYFEDNYILSEDDEGNAFYYLSVENDGSDEDFFHFDLESSNSEAIDLPRIYIQITKNFMEDSTYIFQNFICKAIEDPKVFVTGLDTFIPGRDYYLNKTLFDYLFTEDLINYTDNDECNLDYVLPNYLAQDNNKSINITEYWIDRSGSEDEDYTNLEYYLNKNIVAHTYTFSEDELNAFCSTFCGIILDNAIMTDEIKSTLNNQIYNIVLNYYRNYQSDDTAIALNLILNSLYSTTNESTCGCNTSLNGETNTQTTSCYDLYKQALNTYLIQMLADADFYRDWMYISENCCEKLVNESMIDLLIKLIEEFMSLGYDLSLSYTTNNNCTCKAVDTSKSDCNYKILNNYLKVLYWVKNNEIDANINKIKVFGTQFAEILPLLNF